MNFFSECKTIEEVKTIFRRLSKHFHPDKGGEAALMIELKKQYDEWSPPAERPEPKVYANTFRGGIPNPNPAGYASNAYNAPPNYRASGSYNNTYYEHRSNQHLHDQIRNLEHALANAKEINHHNAGLFKQLERQMKN